MPYTLTMGAVWFLLALLLGIIIGWLLRSITATRQLRRVRAGLNDSAEVHQMRGRIANLEGAAIDRDRLQRELDECRATRRSAVAVPAADVPAVDDGAEVAVIEPTTGDDAASAEPVIATFAAVADESIETGPVLDLDAAAAAIGKKIKLDELTTVEGIGPAIAELCQSIGIHTWADLAAIETSLLRTMLTDAGSRFTVHDPTTWPQQAGLLAAGRWTEFAELTATLDGGRLPES